MRKSWQRFRALFYKEMVQILRDRRTLALFFVLPAIELFLFAYAVSLTVTHLPTVLVDQSLDVRSREFTSALENSGYFDFTVNAMNEEQAIHAIDTGSVKAGVIIPPDFAEQVERGGGAVLIILDGSDSYSVQSGYNAAMTIAQKYSLDLTTRSLEKIGIRGGAVLGEPLSTVTRVLYNPDIRDLIFILPGLIAMIIQNIVVAHSALSIVREREMGTYEQLLATPARPLEMVIAKLVPGMLVVILDMAFILILGVFWFNVPFQGSIALFALLSFLFIVSGMGLGLVISTFSKNQKQAQQITGLLNVLTMLLTGFLYPRITMPFWTQMVGNMIPLTYYMRIIRGIITKGVGITYMWGDTLALLVYALVTLSLAAVLMKKRLD
jgi:ABC-2 type transport system permease protein